MHIGRSGNGNCCIFIVKRFAAFAHNAVSAVGQVDCSVIGQCTFGRGHAVTIHAVDVDCVVVIGPSVADRHAVADFFAGRIVIAVQVDNSVIVNLGPFTAGGNHTIVFFAVLSAG